MDESSIHGDKSATGQGRIEWLDLARGVALVAMAIYHFCWDLESFGYLDQGTAGSGPLKWFARSIASSFLILVGISIVLAHHKGIRWRGYIRRLFMVSASAAAITVTTYFYTPQAYVFFGILHHIALASVMGLMFLRTTFPVLVGCAVIAFCIPYFASMPLFDHPALLWLGLAPFPPVSIDYVPVFPWFSMVLVGMAICKIGLRAGLDLQLADNSPHTSSFTIGLRFLGRNSLATYLLHQPILIAAVFLYSVGFPVAKTPSDVLFFNSCHQACVPDNDDESCKAFCGCAITNLADLGLFEQTYRGEIDQTNDPRVAAVIDQCSFEAEFDGT